MGLNLMRKQMHALCAALSIALCTCAAASTDAKPRLPLPGWNIPELPRLCPTVVTAGGQRLLLADTGVRVAWNAQQNQPTCNRPGWWIINYPLSEITGLGDLTADQIARKVLGEPNARVKNWYLRVSGKPAPEPTSPTAPAPIKLSTRATIIVDQRHPRTGSADAPLRTIQAAVNKAQAGDVIRVMPGIDRESVQITRGGSQDKPVVIEGVRDEQGQMPAITGNDPFPPNAWGAVAGVPGVYRAAIFADRVGAASVNGKGLIERSWYRELEPGEYCLSLGSKEAGRFRVPADASPEAGETIDGMPWVRLAVDEDGFLDLASLEGGAAPNSVYYAFAYVWIEPKKVKETWDPRFPEPTTKRVHVPGGFRAGRETGSSLKAQLNFYRVWCNGERVQSVVYQTPDQKTVPPRPSRNYGKKGDRIESFTMRQGWNRLLFQLDTARRPKQTKLKFEAPKGIDQFVTSTTRPTAKDVSPDAKPAPHVTEYLVLGPFRSEPDEAIYVRLEGDRDPNGELIDAAVRGSALVTCEHDYVHFRGFEVRHGAQFQQRAQVVFKGAGCLVEGCLIRDSEVSGLTIANPRNQQADPLVARNNWIVNTGHTGVNAQHSSTQLTAANQTELAPGRGPIIIEHNVIRMTNWAAHPPFWASGGMKLFRLTGCVIRYNRIEDCFGPGIWLDWEHYNNRIEGNLIRNNWSFGIGIEASPGPNLVANNLIVGMRPGSVWFRWNILDWSTARTVAVNNTIDGQWCQLPCWFNRKGTDGIFIGLEGGPDRGTTWQPIADRGKDRGSVAVNNLILGCTMAMHPKTQGTVAANFSHRGTGAEPLDARPAFIEGNPLDYRLAPQTPLNSRGVANRFTAMASHDFYGLPRPRQGRRSIGAFRRRSLDRAAHRPVIAVELVDGTAIVPSEM